MLNLHRSVAQAIANDISNKRHLVVSTFEVQALSDGATCDTTLKDFVELCYLYASSGASESDPHVTVIGGHAYCTYCGDQVLSARCICADER